MKNDTLEARTIDPMLSALLRPSDSPPSARESNRAPMKTTMTVLGSMHLTEERCGVEGVSGRWAAVSGGRHVHGRDEEVLERHSIHGLAEEDRDVTSQHLLAWQSTHMSVSGTHGVPSVADGKRQRAPPKRN